MVFVDTSAFLSVLSSTDREHLKARDIWLRILSSDDELVTSNYVLVETTAILQNRLGLDAVRVFEQEVVPAMRVEWIDQATHGTAISAVLASGRRKLSLVDCTSFEILRRLGIEQVFAFDPHFAEQGFTVLT